MSSAFLPELFGAAVGSTPPIQDRGYQIAWLDVRDVTTNKIFDASADPTHSQWLEQIHLQDRAQLFKGRIVDAVAYAGNYKVQLEHSQVTLNCSLLGHTGFQPLGVRQLNSIPIGSNVHVLWHPAAEYGVIMGVEPEYVSSGSKTMVDFISQSARSGLSVDQCHKAPFKLKMKGLITDWSTGRPFDATANCEMGYITETGLCESIDPFMVQLRVDESAGFWAFYWDQLARIAGHNLQVWSAASDREDEDDEGEFSSEQGWSPYFWETLGFSFVADIASRSIPANEWQLLAAKQAYAALEPIDDWQAPFFRLRDWYGYYGQGHKRTLALLPEEGLPDPLKTHDDTLFPGVYEENLSLTGRKSFRTAHEFIIAKRLYVPTPKRTKFACDVNGDTEDNYLFASVFGDGEEHKIQGEIETSDAEDQWVRAVGFLDTQMFVFNWEALHPFDYHEKDYELPQESELPYEAETPDFEVLKTQTYMAAPEAIPLYVDHRYGTVNYYPNHSYWALLNDGGSVWGDGFGSEIRMTGGCIDITAPADIRIIAGRNAVVLAGHDAMTRARSSVDISASCHDVRIKAQHNLHMVSNDECSSILLDCRAVGDYCDFAGKFGEDVTLGGIMFKAPNSTVAACSGHIHLTTNNYPNGAIIFEAEYGRVRSIADFVETFVSEAIFDVFYDAPGGTIIENVNEYWATGATICSLLRVKGKLAVADCAWFGGNVYILDGHIFSERADQQGFAVPKLQGAALAAANSIIMGVDMRCDQTTLIGQTELDTLRDYSVCCEAEFSFRTMAQYATQDWTLFETRWQQQARLTEQDIDVWCEVPVVANGTDTYPYPGKEKWKDESTWRMLDLNLFEADKLRAVDRRDPYIEPDFAVPVDIVPDNNFLIINHAL